MAGGTYAHFSAGKTGAGGKNADYVTRDEAVRDGTDGVVVHNMPADVSEGVAEAGSYAEARDHLTAYAHTQEALEVRRHGGRAGEPRTHYRAVLSFERPVTTDRAKAAAAEWLGDRFEGARAFAVVHRNTDHAHVHVWIDARGVDGKKLHFSRSEYRSLDVSWNRVYAREMGRDEREHLAKKEETRAYRKARAEGRPAERPQRDAKRGPSQQDRRPAVAPEEGLRHTLKEIQTRIQALDERREGAERAVVREGQAARQMHAGLQRIYRDPGAAAQRLEAAAREGGLEPALGALREHPQGYGDLRGRGLGPVGNAERREAHAAVRDLSGFLPGYAEARREGGTARAGLAALDLDQAQLRATHARTLEDLSELGRSTGPPMTREERARWEAAMLDQHMDGHSREVSEASSRETSEEQTRDRGDRSGGGWER